jgi:hypothetical protein
MTSSCPIRYTFEMQEGFRLTKTYPSTS